MYLSQHPVFGSCLVVHYLVSFLVLTKKRELLLYFSCLHGVLLLLVFCGSSSHCRLLVCCSVWLWYYSLTFFYTEIPPPLRPFFGHIHVRIIRATLVKGDSKTICTNLGQSKLHDITCFAECEQQTPYILYESVDADCIYFVMREDLYYLFRTIIKLMLLKRSVLLQNIKMTYLLLFSL